MSNRQSIIDDILREARKLHVEGAEREEATFRIIAHVDELDRMEIALRSPVIVAPAKPQSAPITPKSQGAVVRKYPQYDWFESSKIPISKEIKTLFAIVIGWAIACVLFAAAAVARPAITQTTTKTSLVIHYMP